jgi:hypothetical protein
MASTQEVRQYLAHWFQLGKKVTVPDRDSIFTQKVLQGNIYTTEFEACWQEIIAQPHAYVEGTDQTIAELLTDRWDVIDCARCTMPIPLPAAGLPQSQSCTCHDMPTWPNTQVPLPRAAGALLTRTTDLRQRLAKLALLPPESSSDHETK